MSITSTETIFVIPDNSVVHYKMSNVYFKEYTYRKTGTNNNETDYTSTQITYINNTIIMNGLTFLINVNNDKSNDYVVQVEIELLKLYAETYRVVNKRVRYVIDEYILKNSLAHDSCKKVGVGLYIMGIWENQLEYGIEYKWLELTRLL